VRKLVADFDHRPAERFSPAMLRDKSIEAFHESGRTTVIDVPQREQKGLGTRVE
jgi:hypothetical protein